MEHKEANIAINGTTVTEAMSMTIRVAIESFKQDLIANGLGDDEHGQEMRRLYLLRVREIEYLLYGLTPNARLSCAGTASA